MVKLAPSLMCADLLRLEKDIRAMDRAAVDLYHFDVMDGHFVPNLCLGFDLAAQVRTITKTPLMVHLMVDDPALFIPAVARAGAKHVTFHVEAVRRPLGLLRTIRSMGIKAGIALNPGTPVDAIAGVIDEVEHVLLMTVNPGFARQKFISTVLPKIAAVKRLLAGRGRRVPIAVDGGIDEETGRRCIEQGATILVGGTSSIFQPGRDLYTACREFKRKMTTAAGAPPGRASNRTGAPRRPRQRL